MTALTSAEASGTRGDGPAVVWGYLSFENADEIEIAAWRHEIAVYCRSRGLKLAGVRIDRGLPTDQIVRPGFSALLEVLELPTSTGVVIPHPDHLSRDVNAQALLVHRIRHTASRLILIDEVPDTLVPPADQVAYAYLCGQHPSESTVAAAQTRIAAYCERHGLRLGGVFSDLAIDDTAEMPDGLKQLVMTVRSGAAQAVILVDLDHVAGLLLALEAVRAMQEGRDRQLAVLTGVDLDGEVGQS
jgi:DNA invertase Pin-like site-specific DNA recombinase